MKKLFRIGGGFAVATITSHAQVLLSGGLTYSQNFGSLASSPDSSSSAGNWTDNSTLPGWYASRAFTGSTTTPFGPYAYTTYRVDTGSATSGWLYSYGVAGVNAVTDRALGSLSSGTPKTNVFGAWIQNDTGSAVSTLTHNLPTQVSNGAMVATPLCKVSRSATRSARVVLAVLLTPLPLRTMVGPHSLRSALLPPPWARRQPLWMATMRPTAQYSDRPSLRA